MKKFILLLAFFALTACDDSSSAGGDNGSGGNRGGIPDTVETFMELSDYDCGKSQKCVATYLTEYHDMAVCDGDNGWVIGTLIEKMDCDFSSSSAKATDKVSEPAEGPSSSVEKGQPDSDAKSSSSTKETKDSSDSKSSSSVKVSALSSSSGALATPCKTETEDSCEYGTLNDERDGLIYKTVKIGDQWWMAQNLNYAYNEGTAKSYCYDGDSDNCAKYGRLYLWSAAMDSTGVFSSDGEGCGFAYDGTTCSASGTVRGVCPAGWHLPSYNEWETLFRNVGGEASAGRMLKSEEGWNYHFELTEGIDYYGFSALPAGYSDVNGDFHDAGDVAYFWSTSELYSSFAYGMNLYYVSEKAYLNYSSKHYAFSVRCIKD